MSEHPLFTKLYDENAEAIYRFVLARVRAKEVAEDITQDVFVRAFPRARDEALDPKTALPYLYTIARNALTDHYRKKKTVTFEEDDDIFFVPGEETADEFALLGDDRAMLARALATLGEDQRTVLTLHFMEELDFDEIATIIGKNEDAVRQHKSRALKKLREYFQENAPDYRQN